MIRSGSPLINEILPLYETDSARATTFLSEALKEGSPSIHPEFREVDGWSWNKAGLRTSGMKPPTYKVRFFLNATELSLLDGISFPVKFTRNDEAAIPGDYCGIAYPLKDRDFNHVEDWARRFGRAEVFTYGSDKTGEWVPGKFVRLVKKSDRDSD